ncbi:MAG: hypothetical protein V1726_06090 [Methanobacteriota archaeon]
MKVQIIVDEKSIEVNAFVNDFIAGTLTGALSPLKGVKSDWKKLSITVTR